MEDPIDRLRNVAAAVADGSPVDWDAALDSSATERELLRSLRLLSTISAVYQQAEESGPRLDDGSTSALWRWGNLEITDWIGSGTFGDVFRARDTRLDREVALKLRRTPPESALDGGEPELVQEGRLLARVRHPNVAAVYGADRIDSRVGVWMELIEGRTLEEELSERGPFPAEEVVAIGTDLCQGLQALHTAGLLHRDIKAQNVMRDRRDGRIVLMDLSAGRELDRSPAGVDLPRTLAGSPLYLAPEVLDGQAASLRSDIYSLGVLLFRLATGRFPVNGRSLDEIRQGHRERSAADMEGWPAGYPSSLIAVVVQALHADPLHRFESAAALERGLKNAGRPPLRRRRWQQVSAALAALAATGAAAATLGGRYLHPAPPRSGDSIVLFVGPAGGGTESTTEALSRALQRHIVDGGVAAAASPSRVEDVLRRTRRAAQTQIDVALARELARRDQAIRAVVSSRITPGAGGETVTTEILRPDDGSALRRVGTDLTRSGAGLEGHAQEVRDLLIQALPSLERRARPLEQVTTSSIEALQLYSRAAELLEGERWLTTEAQRLISIPERPTGSNLYEASEALLKQATDIDPAFASAWLLRAHLSSQRTAGAPEFLLVERALANIEPVTPLERAFITAYAGELYASAGIDPIGNLQRAARFYESALQFAPQHHHTMIQLPAVYRRLSRLTDFDRVTLDALRAYPDSLRFGVDAVKGYVRTRRMDLAAPIAERLLGRDTSAWEADSRTLSNAIAWLRLWKVHGDWIAGDSPGALRHLREADARWSHIRTRLWLHHLVQAYGGLGRFDEAEGVAARMNPEYRQWWEASISVWREDHETFRRLTAPHLGRFEVLHNRSGMLSRMGWTKTAAWVAAERERRHVRMPWGEKVVDQGQLAVVQGRHAAGVAMLEAGIAGRIWGPDAGIPFYESAAIGKRALGDLAGAIALLERLGSVPASAVMSQWSVHPWLRCRVLLAELYRDSGRTAEAQAVAREVQQYLSAADAGHPLVHRLQPLLQ